MAKDLEKKPDDLPVSDGFDGFEDGIEGADGQETSRIIQGTLVRFTNDFAWMTNDDDELSATLELIVIDVLRIVQYWKPDGTADNDKTIILGPGKLFPDVDAMNAAAPKSEWSEKFGKMVGPWRRQHVTYMLDPATMSKFTFPTSSIGGAIGVTELVDKVKWMRKCRGAHVCPVITVATKPFPTSYGMRKRPHFNVVRWVDLSSGGGGDLLPAAHTPTSGDTGAKEKQPEAKKAAAVGKSVTEPTIKEDMNDDLPF
jgi:hypothetical protein